MSDVEWLRQYSMLDGGQLQELWIELDRLRAERDDAVKKMEAGWLVVAESAMTPVVQERDALRKERWELGVQVGRLEIERDTLRGQNERLRDELVALQARADVLRELVREAKDDLNWNREQDWYKRAEKALGD